MKILKKSLALILTLALVLTSAVTVFGASQTLSVKGGDGKYYQVTFTDVISSSKATSSGRDLLKVTVPVGSKVTFDFPFYGLMVLSPSSGYTTNTEQDVMNYQSMVKQSTSLTNIAEGASVNNFSLEFVKTGRMGIAPAYYSLGGDSQAILLDIQVTEKQAVTPSVDTSIIANKMSGSAKSVETQLIKFGENVTKYTGYRGAELDSWAVNEASIAAAMGLMPTEVNDYFHEPINREHFAILVFNTIKTITGMSDSELAVFHNGQSGFSDTNSYQVIACKTMGIVTGNTDGTYKPNNKISREEAAAMLSRMGKVLGCKATGNQPYLNDISGRWSENDIKNVSKMVNPYTVNQNGAVSVMGSVGNDRFDPTGSYTRQQAVVTMVRMAGATAASYK